MKRLKYAFTIKNFAIKKNKFSWHSFFHVTERSTEKNTKFWNFCKIMYSVSETIEDGSPFVTVHPGIWRKDKILLWPPPGSGIRKTDIVSPGPDWIQFECLILRDNIGK